MKYIYITSTLHRICFLLCFFFINIQATGENKNYFPDVYNKIKNIRSPTFEDYCLVQNFLTNGNRKNLEKLKDTFRAQKNIKIIDVKLNKIPQLEIIPVNTDLNDKKNCLILYASFNCCFPKGVKRLISIVKQSNFKGHILCRIGGWPDVAGGSLTLAHVPFAFKVCSFKEAQRLGYERVLWLDSSIVPLVDLDTVFTTIGKKGYFSVENTVSVGPWCNEKAASYFGYSLKETYNIKCCQAGVLGVDFKTEIGQKIIDRWHKAAEDENAFYSARSDQTALSLILHQCNLQSQPSYIAGRQEELQEWRSKGAQIETKPLFLVDRNFVK